MTTAKDNRKQKLVTQGWHRGNNTLTSHQFSLPSNPGRNITLGLFEAGCFPRFLASHIQCSDSIYLQVSSFLILLTLCFRWFVYFFLMIT